MLTGNDGFLDRMKGKMSACDEYLVKPVDAAELLQLVRKHINLPL
jgi:DNA-binding response OmpR family regulator